MFGLSQETSDYLIACNRRVVAHMAAHKTRELRRWGRQDRRGRWVVLELDTKMRRRGRRFSSLSRARRFATEVRGELKRWHAREWTVERFRSWLIPGLALGPYVSIERTP